MDGSSAILGEGLAPLACEQQPLHAFAVSSADASRAQELVTPILFSSISLSSMKAVLRLLDTFVRQPSRVPLVKHLSYCFDGLEVGSRLAKVNWNGLRSVNSTLR